MLALFSVALILYPSGEAVADLKLRELHGKVVEVSNADAASRKKGLPATIVVEGDKVKLTVTVPVRTSIFKKVGKTLKGCRIDDLTVGCQVRVVYILLEAEKGVKARSVEILDGSK
jgi:hypothetical protein